MKNIPLKILVCSSLFGLVGSHAALLFEDAFSSVSANYNFADDGTPTTSVGTGLSHATLESSGGSLDFSIFQTNSLDADSTATNSADFTSEFLDNADVIYISVLMQVPDLAAFGNDGGSVYAGFGGSGVDPGNFGIGLEVDGSGNISYSSLSDGATQDQGGSVAEGQTVFLVARLTGWPDGPQYDPIGSFEYLLNPDPASAEPASWTAVTTLGGNLNKMTADKAYIRTNAFSAAWNDDNDARFLVDELRVGTSWGDVTPTVVPEPSTYALLSGALALGLVILRRRLNG